MRASLTRVKYIFCRKLTWQVFHKSLIFSFLFPLQNHSKWLKFVYVRKNIFLLMMQKKTVSKVVCSKYFLSSCHKGVVSPLSYILHAYKYFLETHYLFMKMFMVTLNLYVHTSSNNKGYICWWHYYLLRLLCHMHIEWKKEDKIII